MPKHPGALCSPLGSAQSSCKYSVVSKQQFTPQRVRRSVCSNEVQQQTLGLMNVRRRLAENPRHSWINGQVIYDIGLRGGRLHPSFSTEVPFTMQGPCCDFDPLHMIH